MNESLEKRRTEYTPSRRSPQNRTRKRRRKSNMSLYYIMVAIIVLAAAYFLSNFVFFKIDEIKVSGSTYYAKETVIAESQARIGDNLFRTDIKGIEERLSQLMVYADEVKVRRKLPSQLVITVKEAVPKYNLEQNGMYYVVSESGKILESNLSQPKQGLMLVTGFEIKDTTPNAKLESEDNLKAEILTEIAETLESMKFNGIGQIDLSDRTDIKLMYQGRIEIRIGSSMDIPYKLSYTRAVLDSIMETYGDEYEGTLIYHSATAGMSAISKDKQNETVITPDNVDNVLEDENALPEDESESGTEEDAEE